MMKPTILAISEALNDLAKNGPKNHLIRGDSNTSLNKDMNYVGYTKDPHCASREVLHGLQEDGVLVDV